MVPKAGKISIKKCSLNDAVYNALWIVPDQFLLLIWLWYHLETAVFELLSKYYEIGQYYI